MGSEKYKLKWSKYESNILAVFSALLENETLSDVTLFCEGQTFKAHRLVLAACSPHFETLFSHTPVTATNNNQFFVILDGTRADDLQILLHFMYRGEAYLHHDRINSVLRTAEVLQVKGLSEGPKSFELNSQQHGSGIHNERSSSGGGNVGGLHQSTSSAQRSWSPPLHAASEAGSAHQRSSVGIMGNIKRKERDRERDSRIDYHHHSLQRLERDREMEISAHPSIRSSGRAISPDHGVSPPYSYPTPRENFGMYGGSGSSGFRGNLPPFPGPPRHQDACSSSNREYSPNRDNRRSPVVIKTNTPPAGVASSRGTYQQHGGPQPSKYTPSPPPQAHGQPSSEPLKDEREREDPYDLARSSSRDNRNGGSNAGNLQTRSPATLERQTPSDKGDRHTPAHGSAGGGDFDQRSSRNSPSPAATPASHVSSMGKVTPSTFPSDSTTDVTGRAVAPNSESGGRGLIRSSSYKEERIRRLSDAASDIGPSRPHDKYEEFQGSRVDLQRIGSPNRADVRMANSDDEACTQAAANNLEAFRRIAQAHAERERFLPGAPVMMNNPLAQNLTATASDYMRLAMPVRDPDNGDAISGSGTKLRCPFCERTYGYETNLRAHIRQRHQGIRVSCPYCPRTFTRNNTVRRHVAREHRHLGGRIPTKFGSTRVMPDPIRIAQTAAVTMRNVNVGAVQLPPLEAPSSAAGNTGPN